MSATMLLGGRRRPMRRTITLLAGTWLVLGVFIDGWAHFNRPGAETFFTPWHAVLYSGAVSLFGWLLVPTRDTSRTDRLWAATAAGIFGTGATGDLLWHEVFGVEVGLDALVSPTHLLLLLGALLGVTAPLRESLNQPDRRFAAVTSLGSLTLAAALTAFFVIYLSPFATEAPTWALTAIPEGAAGHAEAEGPAIAGFAAYLVSTAVVVVPVLVLHTRGLLFFGGVTTVVTVVATLSSALTEFAQPATPAVALIAGLASDAVIHGSGRLSPSIQPTVIGVVLPLSLWTLQLVALHVTAGLRWPAELIVGAVLLSALFGGMLGLLAGPRASPPMASKLS